MTKRIRPTCKDCATPHGMDWWTATYASSGPHSARCHSCYLAYTRANQNARLHGRTYRNPAAWCAHPLGPPKPRRIIRACSDCAAPFGKVGQAERCATCTITNEAARRGRAMALRVEAERSGDKGISWRRLGERDGWRCHLCRQPVQQVAGTAYVPGGATVDHLVPISAGGSHTWANVALAHRSCNSARGAKGLVQLRLAG